MTSMDSSDIVIIGGGPSGSLAAISSKVTKKDVKVEVLEQRRRIGLPPHCSGLIGISGLKELKIFDSLAKKVIQNKINSATFFSNPIGNNLHDCRKG